MVVAFPFVTSSQAYYRSSIYILKNKSGDGQAYSISDIGKNVYF